MSKKQPVTIEGEVLAEELPLTEFLSSYYPHLIVLYEQEKSTPEQRRWCRKHVGPENTQLNIQPLHPEKFWSYGWKRVSLFDAKDDKRTHPNLLFNPWVPMFAFHSSVSASHFKLVFGGEYENMRS
jgi:hypothetical protein